MSLLTDSGKIGTYNMLVRESDKLLVEIKALDKKGAELNEQVARDQRNSGKGRKS